MDFVGHTIGISMDAFLVIPAVLAGLLLRSWMILIVTLGVAVVLTLRSTGMDVYWILPRFVGGTIIAFMVYGVKTFLLSLFHRKPSRT